MNKKLILILINIYNFVHILAPAKVEKIIPSFQDNQIIMVAPAESCGGVILQQPTTAIENWDYKTDILELKPWRNFVGENNVLERVPLNNPIEIKYDSPEEVKKNPAKLKTFYVMYDSSGTIISDYYSISCSKKRIVDGKTVEEPKQIDCRGVINIAGYQESDKYLRCNSKMGPLEGYSFQPFNLNVVQPLETAPLTRGITTIFKPEK